MHYQLVRWHSIIKPPPLSAFYTRPQPAWFITINTGICGASPSIRRPVWAVTSRLRCWTQGHVASALSSATFYTIQWWRWCDVIYFFFFYSLARTCCALEKHVGSRLRRRGLGESKRRLESRELPLMCACASESLNNWWGRWETALAHGLPSVTLVDKNRCCPRNR